MHMVATNLCEWLYTLVEETKHEIWHLSHSTHPIPHGANKTTENIIYDESMALSNFQNRTNVEHNILKRSIVVSSEKYEECQRTNIMGSLVIMFTVLQKAKPVMMNVFRFKMHHLSFFHALLSILLYAQ